MRREPIQRGLSISVMDDLTRGPHGVSVVSGEEGEEGKGLSRLLTLPHISRSSLHMTSTSAPAAAPAGD